jgi:hypothetical protein
MFEASMSGIWRLVRLSFSEPAERLKKGWYHLGEVKLKSGKRYDAYISEEFDVTHQDALKSLDEQWKKWISVYDIDFTSGTDDEEEQEDLEIDNKVLFDIIDLHQMRWIDEEELEGEYDPLKPENRKIMFEMFTPAVFKRVGLEKEPIFSEVWKGRGKHGAQKFSF